MLRFSSCALVLGAAFAAFGGVSTASAQINQFGMWGEAPERSRRSSPSFLGAPPAVATKPAVGLASGGARPNIGAKAPQTIAFRNGFKPGSIIIDTAGRKLYYTLSQSSAYVYPIAVGKQGFAWTGVERVSRIVEWPDWHPPAEMRQRQPTLPVRMTGGIRNPLGAKAIYLGNTLYRIHGTNDSKSIGSASSSGCFRMHNGHVVHLARHVGPSTMVYVMKRLPKSGTIMPPGGGGGSGVQEVKQAPPAQPAPASAEQPPPAAEATPEAPATEQPADQGI